MLLELSWFEDEGLELTARLAPDDHEQLRLVQLQNEARLGFDEVRVLIALRDCVDLDLVAADLARDRGQVFGRRDDSMYLARMVKGLRS